MDFGIVKDLLMFLLPGGALGSVVTWFATRRERNVTALAKLQESIDLLTKKYSAVLDENVQLKADNAEYRANQQILEAKIDALTERVNLLTEQLKKNENEIESNIAGVSRKAAARRPSGAGGGVVRNAGKTVPKRVVRGDAVAAGHRGGKRQRKDVGDERPSGDVGDGGHDGGDGAGGDSLDDGPGDGTVRPS